MRSVTLVRFIALWVLGIAASAALFGDPATYPLKDGWRMQSASVVKDGGGVVTGDLFQADSWYPISVPSTVLAGLVANGEYPGLFVGDAIKKVDTARFHSAWWYRKEFSLPALPEGGQVWLQFKGINYRAEIWLNGRHIAGPAEVAGAYRSYEFNVTECAHCGGKNVLAVRVSPPDPKKDLAITFVDWAPAPPDLNMGLWQDVSVATSGPVALRNPFVATDLALPGLDQASLTVQAEASNASDQPVEGVLEGQIESVHFSQTLALGPKETKTVVFTPEAFPQLLLRRPRIWWPWQLGRAERYQLNLRFAVNHQASDAASVGFGIRKVTSRMNDGKILFSVNGVDFLVLGGGYAPDLLQRRSLPGRPDWQEDQIRYVRGMNLNTVRLEGKLEDDAFYDLCDKYGVLVMAGWCCCSPWEQWKNWGPEQHAISKASLRTQIERARNHPSLLVWLNGSDKHPPADVEQDYLGIEKELGWPCPTLSSASASKSDVSGPSGVKMEGPYKWEPPIFWTTDTKTGGAWGFNTEVGPGAVPPPLESLEAMLPPGNRWPIDEVWNAHAGGGTFHTIGDFTQALDKRFGPSKGIADFSWKAQAQAYETIRAMFEAFRRNKFSATGEIQWMLNNAWPSNLWHLYDYYLRPGGAYFATKLACEPLHLLYGYDNRSVSLVNDAAIGRPKLTAEASVYDLDGHLRFTRKIDCSAPAGSSTALFAIPQFEGISTTYFLRLRLSYAGGNDIGINSYWLSTVPDVLGKNEGKESWNVTPTVSFADYTALESLPRVDLSLGHLSVSSDGKESVAKVRVSNPSKSVAFLVRLKLTRGKGGEEVLPVRWDDNYFLLLPGESRQVGARFLKTDLGAAEPAVSVDCYNNARNG